MRIFKTIILFLFASQCFSQNLDSFFMVSKLPDGVTIEIERASNPLGSFPTNYVATIIFKTDNASVYYFAFNYKTSDSTTFKKAELDYWMVSGCNIVFNKDFNKNFGSFIYGGYFLLLQHCACSTGENESCAELASRLNHWRKDY